MVKRVYLEANFHKPLTNRISKSHHTSFKHNVKKNAKENAVQEWRLITSVADRTPMRSEVKQAPTSKHSPLASKECHQTSTPTPYLIKRSTHTLCTRTPLITDLTNVYWRNNMKPPSILAWISIELTLRVHSHNSKKLMKKSNILKQQCSMLIRLSTTQMTSDNTAVLKILHTNIATNQMILQQRPLSHKYLTSWNISLPKMRDSMLNSMSILTVLCRPNFMPKTPLNRITDNNLSTNNNTQLSSNRLLLLDEGCLRWEIRLIQVKKKHKTISKRLVPSD